MTVAPTIERLAARTTRIYVQYLEARNAERAKAKEHWLGFCQGVELLAEVSPDLWPISPYAYEIIVSEVWREVTKTPRSAHDRNVAFRTALAVRLEDKP